MRLILALMDFLSILHSNSLTNSCDKHLQYPDYQLKSYPYDEQEFYPGTNPY
jgi:hypothetical protein